jgi:hypothetical protein
MPPFGVNDPIIVINPLDVDLVIKRLRAVADELRGSGAQIWGWSKRRTK